MASRLALAKEGRRHLLKCVSLKDGKETTIFSKPGSAMWTTSAVQTSKGHGVVGTYLALATSGGNVALLSSIDSRQMHGAHYHEGRLKIWNLDQKKESGDCRNQGSQPTHGVVSRWQPVGLRQINPDQANPGKGSWFGTSRFLREAWMGRPRSSPGPRNYARSIWRREKPRILIFPRWLIALGILLRWS